MSDETEYTRDVMLPLGSCDHGLHVLRLRGDDDGVREASTGVISEVEEGKPIMGEYLHARPVTGKNYMEVESIYLPESERIRRESSKGPSTVSTEAYKSGWDHVFGQHSPEDPFD